MSKPQSKVHISTFVRYTSTLLVYIFYICNESSWKTVKDITACDRYLLPYLSVIIIITILLCGERYSIEEIVYEIRGHPFLLECENSADLAARFRETFWKNLRGWFIKIDDFVLFYLCVVALRWNGGKSALFVCELFH